MIKSMTGFGKSVCELTDKTINIEIRTLNSKQLDVIFKIPTIYKEKENEIRSLLSNKLERGKIDLSMTVESSGGTSKFNINKELAKQYFDELSLLSEEMGDVKSIDYLSIVMRMPEVLSQAKEELKEDEWESIKGAIIEAVADLDKFRIEEGKNLQEDFLQRNSLIIDLLSQIEAFESVRIETIRTRIKKELQQLVDDQSFDMNRFEQELIYYIEKLDITEEKVRLKKHCEFFIDTVNESQSSGKKLGFISQEMGREINTIGSKANDVSIQKIVVQMKDELEKIKEQLSNVL